MQTGTLLLAYSAERASTEMEPVLEWDRVLNAKPDGIEADKALLEDLYTFLSRTKLPESFDEGVVTS